MSDLSGRTAGTLTAHAAGSDRTQPLLTWYDDATGERVELSGVTLDNWVAKTANLLVDGCGLGPGDTALVALPPHWQTAAVLLGCWSAGVTVVPDGAADVAFASPAVETSAGDRFYLGLAPLGMPYLGELPAGWVDFIAEVRPHGDHFRPVAPVRPDGPALGTETHAALLARAGARAADLGVAAGGRVLVDVAAYPDPVDWLVAPLTAGASVVLCKDLADGARERRAEAERAGLILA